MKVLTDSHTAGPRKIGGWATAGLLCALLAVPALGLNSFAAAADTFPPTSPYLGEIRRDASGKLIVMPAKAPAAEAAGQSASGTARILRVGPQLAIRTIAAAAALARDGDIIEIEAGDYMGDVAIWTQNKLTLRGVGGRPRLIAAGASAEQKAIWVVRGGDITVENIEFTGARVPDKNGAGIRFERGRLIVRNCHFHDNENGILTGGGDGELDIEDSEFGHNGRSEGHNHNIYIGRSRSCASLAVIFITAKAAIC